MSPCWFARHPAWPAYESARGLFFSFSRRPVSAHPPLAALLAQLGQAPGSPLAFLARASEASVLKGGYTNALYLVRVPDVTDSEGAAVGGDAADGSAGASAGGRAGGGRGGLWVVRKSVGGGADGDDDPLYRVHRICRASEHEAVTAAAARGLTPTALFEPRANLLAQVWGLSVEAIREPLRERERVVEIKRR